MSNAVEATANNLPAMVATPALDIGSEDVALPRLYIGQFSSPFVQEGLVAAGDIFTAAGKDDPDPVVLAKAKAKKGVELDDGPTFYVLALRRGKSITVDGELQLFDYNDPDVPKEAWTTYNYAIAIPSADDEVPLKFLLTRSGAPAAKSMNTVLKKNEGRGPAYEIAFKLGNVFRENTKGKWFAPKVRHVEADASDVEVAARLSELVNGQNASRMDVAASGDEPAI